MERFIKGRKTDGKYYVRPIDWAGQWDKDGNLVYGNTAFESEKEDECDIYITECSKDSGKFDFNGIMGCITKNDKLKHLLSENPEMPIMFLCGEECYNDDFGYTVNTGSFAIEEVTLVDDMICDDRADLEEKIYEKMDREYPCASENLLNKLTDALLEKYIWKKVISVRIG